MSTMTLSGREAPSTKRIDVEANLLDQWVLERQETKTQIKQRLFVLAGIVGLGVWGATALNHWRAGVAIKQAPVAQRLKAVQAQYSEIVPQNTGTSEAEIEKMAGTAKGHAEGYMAQVVALMNSASQSLAFSSLKVDVLGGEVKLSGQADAETYYAANEFIQRNNDASKGMNATQVSTSRSDLLANDGVSFQFVKKVRVSQ